MLPSVRRASLGLIKKMVQYVQADTLKTLCSDSSEMNLGTLLVEVVASVLDNEVSQQVKTRLIFNFPCTLFIENLCELRIKLSSFGG